MMRSKTIKEDGTVDIRLGPRTIGETRVGEPPGKDDIEALLVPLCGGGEYIVINQGTKKVRERHRFDGPAKDPDEPVPPVSPAPSPVAAIFQSPGTVQPSSPAPAQPAEALDEIETALLKALEHAGEAEADDDVSEDEATDEE